MIVIVDIQGNGDPNHAEGKDLGLSPPALVVHDQRHGKAVSFTCPS